jgi:hypothetical protein
MAMSRSCSLKAGTSSGLPLPRTCDFPDRCLRIKTEEPAELDELDDIDAPLTAFEPRDERLIFPESFRKLRLGHAGCLAPFNEERDKGLMPI